MDVRRDEGEPTRMAPDPTTSDGASGDGPHRGQLVVISGPSGVGKTTIVDGLGRCWSFHFSVSTTTRPPRPGEEAGVDYDFVNRAEFQAMVEGGQFLEWAEYANNLYGTPRRPVLDALEQGRNVLLDIEVRGAIQVMESYPGTVTIFVMPPSVAMLEERLRHRKDTDEAAIRGRMAVAEMQMAVGWDRFDHQVINADVEAAITQIVGILEAENSPG